jgi:hypothetical protein
MDLHEMYESFGSWQEWQRRQALLARVFGWRPAPLEPDRAVWERQELERWYQLTDEYHQIDRRPDVSRVRPLGEESNHDQPRQETTHDPLGRTRKSTRAAGA